MQINDICKSKNILREKLKNKRLAFTQEQKYEYDEKILMRISALYQYKNSPIILSYVSKDIEVDTMKLIDMALADGKCVAVPKCIDGTRKMDFYFITSVRDLKKGSFGVLEPKTEYCKKLTDFSNCFCIVPGLSFDTDGFRLGYGKGYYDRFLSVFNGTTAGLCYSCCIEHKLPKGNFDKSVDFVVTEKYIRCVKKA